VQPQSSQTPSSVRDDLLVGLRSAEASTVGDLTPEALLDAYRTEVLNRAADFLSEIGTPINGERSEHERGVMYASERLRALGEPGGAA
jgi:hypothetical protein